MMTTPSRPAPPPPPMRKGQVQAFEAISNYTAKRDCELSFEEGDLLFILDQSDPTWWKASLDNKQGYVPSTHVSSENAKFAIIDAARRGNLALLEECLNAGVSVNCLDKAGNSALHAASQAGHIHIVTKLLLHPKVQIDLQNKLGDTPLHCASYRGHPEVVQLLLNYHATLDISNNDNYTPRNLAKKPAVITLLEEGQFTGQRKSCGYDDTEYGAADSEDSD